MALTVEHYSDPGCPWAYSASPAHAALRWRYGSQLRWRLVMIGLTEHAEQYEQRGYTPAGSALGYLGFRRYGMPFTTEPRRRIPATSRACRAVVAVRLRSPELEQATFRALQLGWFTTPLVLDEPADIARALERVDGLDVAATLAALDTPAVLEAYEQDRAQARSAANSPTAFQGKAANSDGAVRYTAPSLIFEGPAGRLEAGGFQPVEAYDVLIANLDVSLERVAAPANPLPALRATSFGLTTAEVAAVMTAGNDAPDRTQAEATLIELVAEGSVRRVPLADDALWVAATDA